MARLVEVLPSKAQVDLVDLLAQVDLVVLEDLPSEGREVAAVLQGLASEVS